MIRLLRGHVVVREVKPKHSIFWTPDANPRDVKTHRGIVLGLGKPALVANRHEVAHGYEVGDEVLFHFERNEGGATHPWVDGKPALWMAQWEIDAVVEP